MKHKFDSNLPIYLQVMEEIKKDIINKKYVLGDKIPSVRELALYYGANPNTIQKALSELEREGLLRSERAVGRYVTDQKERISVLKKEASDTIVENFIRNMKEIGFTKADIIKIIEKSKL